MNAAISKPDRPDILVRQPHFRRDWKVSAIREVPRPVGGELHFDNHSFHSLPFVLFVKFVIIRAIRVAKEFP